MAAIAVVTIRFFVIAFILSTYKEMSDLGGRERSTNRISRLIDLSGCTLADLIDQN